MRTKNPGSYRTLTVVGATSALQCDVHIAEEGITLGFVRTPDSLIKCVSWMQDEPDGPTRASRTGFESARRLAISEMEELLRGERARSAGVSNNILVSDVNARECILTYAGMNISFFCPVDEKLTWNTLKFGGKMNRYNSGPEPYFTTSEWSALKGRAFNRLKQKRASMGYADDGLGLLIETSQLRLAV